VAHFGEKERKLYNKKSLKEHQQIIESLDLRRDECKSALECLRFLDYIRKSSNRPLFFAL